MAFHKITPHIVGAMKKLIKKNLSQRKIARIFSISSGTVSYWLGKGGRKRPKARATKPRISARRTYVKNCVHSTAKSAKDILCALKKATGVLVSKQTIIRDLHALGFKSRVRPKSCCLTTDYAARVAFATLHLKDDPNVMCFSDEKVFTSNDESMRLQWMMEGDTPLPRLKTRWPAGRVMVWGCIGIGFRHLQVIPEGTALNSNNYIRICLSPIRKHLQGKVFQQDNAPCHASSRTSQYLTRQLIRTISWTPRSPDMNVIEVLWAIMQRRVSALAPTCRNTLIAAVRKVWDELDQSTIDGLILGWNARLARVIQKNGRMEM